MTAPVKHKKEKLPTPRAYRENKVAKRKLKDYQPIVTASQEEEKYQTRLDNIEYNIEIK